MHKNQLLMRKMNLMSSDNKCNPFSLDTSQIGHKNGKCSVTFRTFFSSVHFNVNAATWAKHGQLIRDPLLVCNHQMLAEVT